MKTAASRAATTTRSTKTSTTRTSRSTTRTTTRTTTSRTEAEPFALSLGSNQGDAEVVLASALDRLSRLFGPLEVASLYRTAPVGPPDQPDFLNTVATGTTTYDADQVLAAAQALELAAGRRRGRRFGPRPLDVDLLLFGDRVSDRPELTLPHPRLAERRFVLVPLAEIAPDRRVPPGGRTVAELLAATRDAGRVEEVGWRLRPGGINPPGRS